MPVTEQGKEAAVKALKERQLNKPKRINNASLYAGSPMYFYCIMCGYLAGTLPESYTCTPPELCSECEAMKDLGWLEC